MINNLVALNSTARFRLLNAALAIFDGFTLAKHLCSKKFREIAKRGRNQCTQFYLMYLSNFSNTVFVTSQLLNKLAVYFTLS